MASKPDRSLTPRPVDTTLQRGYLNSRSLTALRRSNQGPFPRQLKREGPPRFNPSWRHAGSVPQAKGLPTWDPLQTRNP
ncbi:hypothetical protein V2G26_009028 [Clonostachys chloroleuca]